MNESLPNRGRLLIVDDEEAALRTLERAMAKEGYEVATAASGPAALDRIGREPFDVLLTDLRMEEVDGMRLLKVCREQRPDAEVVMITGFATADAAVQAMKQGAFYFVAKPFRLTEVRRVVAEAMDKIRLRAENRRLREEVDAVRDDGTRIVTQDVGMERLLDLARQVAPTDCSVLIVGESGTGKELFARYLHRQSRRAGGPFVAVNCGAFNGELLANELFGHQKEAFTGASSQRKGLVEAASGGTLFLDEITEMTSDMQVKLLRVIQEREVLRLGATEPVKVDLRVVAASNRDVTAAVRDGVLRQDLYYRLNVVTVDIPPLRARKGDIPLLLQHFLRRHAAQMGKTVTGASPPALEALMNYDYPGNVRELENLVARGTALARGDAIDIVDLPEALRQAPAFARVKDGAAVATLEEQERKYIRWVLAGTGGNQTAAAQLLGIDRSSLWRKLKAYEAVGK